VIVEALKAAIEAEEAVSGPINDRQKRFFFSLDGVEEIPSV
jgi:hypothetical protein